MPWQDACGSEAPDWSKMCKGHHWLDSWPNAHGWLCRVPAAVRHLTGLVEVALQHLTALLSCVQLPAGNLMPLLRLSSQSLVIPGLDILRIKALGVHLCVAPVKL